MWRWAQPWTYRRHRSRQRDALSTHPRHPCSSPPPCSRHLGQRRRCLGNANVAIVILLRLLSLLVHFHDANDEDCCAAAVAQHAGAVPLAISLRAGSARPPDGSHAAERRTALCRLSFWQHRGFRRLFARLLALQGRDGCGGTAGAPMDSAGLQRLGAISDRRRPPIRRGATSFGPFVLHRRVVAGVGSKPDPVDACAL